MKRNAIHCNVCGITVESFSRHDWRACNCPPDTMVFVDGGFDYMRSGCGPLADFTVIDEEYVPPAVPALEHTDTVLSNVHHPSRCGGQVCTLHNRSAHSKRSWVQHWNQDKGRMERISPKSGRHYVDPDELA